MYRTMPAMKTEAQPDPLLIERRLRALEAQNRRQRHIIHGLVLAACSLPLLAAIQGQQATPANDALCIRASDGSEVRIEERKGQGFGIFLLDKQGKLRGRLTLDKDTSLLSLTDSEGQAAAVLEAGASGAASGIRQNAAWRIKDELRGKVPLRSFFDGQGIERLRSGLLKDEPVVTLRDTKGIDRAWMMVEKGPHAAIVVRGDGSAEAALHARLGTNIGFGLRSPNGKQKAGILADDKNCQAFFYAPDESQRIEINAQKGRLSVEAIDEQGQARMQLGVLNNRSRLVQRKRDGKILEEHSEPATPNLHGDGKKR